MSGEPTPDAWVEARKTARIHGYHDDINGLSFAEGWRLGRESVYDGWARQVAEGMDATVDELPALEERAELARQRVEAKVRAEVAAEIRAAFVAGAKVPPWTLRNGMPLASSLAEWAARIAEGQPKNITKEEPMTGGDEDQHSGGGSGGN